MARGVALLLLCLGAVACERAERSSAQATSARPEAEPPDTLVAAPRAPETIPGSMVYGQVHIGSTCRDAVLLIGDADPRRLPADSTLRLPVLAGPLRVAVRAGGGAGWDSTFTVVAGTDHRLGMRPLRCP